LSILPFSNGADREGHCEYEQQFPEGGPEPKLLG
jgi:hypothetical protein